MSSFLGVTSALHFCFCIPLLVGFSLTLGQCALAQIPFSSLAVVLLTCEQRWARLVGLSCAVLKFTSFRCKCSVCCWNDVLVCAFLFYIVLKVKFLLLKGTVKVLKPWALLGKFLARCYPQFCPCSSDWTSRSPPGRRSGAPRCVIAALLGWRPLVAVGPGCREGRWKRFPPQLGLNDLRWLLFISSLRFALLPNSNSSLSGEREFCKSSLYLTGLSDELWLKKIWD